MQEFLDFTRKLATESAAVILPWFGNSDLAVERKSDDSPVTIADREAEQRMRTLIRRRYPSHGIIGEEFGEENPAADHVWVLDPIDGTKSFAHGCPLFGTLISLVREGQPLLGAINLPALNQLCLSDGNQTWLNGKTVRIGNTASLDEALLLATDVRDIAKYQNGDAFDTLSNTSRLTRTWGDCYGYVLVASGWADIMVDPIMNPWDLLALIPVIRGAGGVISDWQGKDPVGGNSIVAANPALHPQVIEMLNTP